MLLHGKIRRCSQEIQDCISPFINLTGIEIFALSFTKLADEKENHKFADEFKKQMSQRHKEAYKNHVNKDHPLVGLLISDWLYERPELEAAMLGGRVNNATRTVAGLRNDDERLRWQNVPREEFHTTVPSQRWALSGNDTAGDYGMFID